MAARRKKPDTTLDQTLGNFKRAALLLSKVVKKQATATQPGEYDLPVLINATEKHMRTVALLIEAAPLLELRLHIEPIQHVIDWLLDSAEYTGETRETIIEALKTYQEEVLTKTGHYQPKTNQMRLV